MKEFLGSLATVVLGSGVAIAIARFIFDHKRDKRVRDDAIKYLALQLAFQYEAFAIECERIASDNMTADESGGHAEVLRYLVSRSPNNYLEAIPIVSLSPTF